MSIVAAKNGKSYIITISPKDEDGNAVTPSSATWSLRDAYGNTINSRDDVVDAAPSTSRVIVLDPDDVNLADGETRTFTYDFRYDSTNGSGLYGGESFDFLIEEV